jgi:hypothetical protein
MLKELKCNKVMKKLGFIVMVIISILWGKEVTLAQGKKKG